MPFGGRFEMSEAWSSASTFRKCLPHSRTLVCVLAWAILTRPLSAAPLTIAVFGDYGAASLGEESVSRMVKSWQPDAVLTTGDNNYPLGGAGSIDRNIGQFYQEFIGNYQGTYGPGAGEGPRANRFFPSLGNHDWRTLGAQPYLDYFDLPGAGYESTSGNERYYDFQLGDVRFFAYDSDFNEPDGHALGSQQAEWLRTELAASEAKWNFVYFHHPPFSSAAHGSTPSMQLPFKEWGADAVLSGHDHVYERVLQDGLPYFVTGLGGNGGYYFYETVCGSRVRFNEQYGAMRITVDGDQAEFEFRSIDDGAEGDAAGAVIDRYVIDKNLPPIEPIPGDTNNDGGVDLTDLNNVRNLLGTTIGGDANHDCRVNLADLNAVRNGFGGQGSGDANGDGVIDLLDLNAARNNFGRPVIVDFDGDQIVDLNDLNAVRNNFGVTSATPVPEPSTWFLLAIGGVLLCRLALSPLREHAPRRV